MAEERNIRIEDSDGNIYYPHTKASNVKTSDGKNVETKLTEVFQSGLDGKNLLETSIKSKGGTVSKQGAVATFNELDLGIKSIETDNTGDATAVTGDILSGKTAYVKGKKLTGNMANRGAIDNTITTQGGQITIPSGYHNGSGKVKAQFPNLVASNIRKGVNIGGITGTMISAWINNITGEAHDCTILKTGNKSSGSFETVIPPEGGGYIRIYLMLFLTYTSDLDLNLYRNGTKIDSISESNASSDTYSVRGSFSPGDELSVSFRMSMSYSTSYLFYTI